MYFVLGTSLIELILPSALFPQEAKSYITVTNLLMVALILQWDHFPIINLISSTRRDFFFYLKGESQLQKCALHTGEVMVSRRETPFPGHTCFQVSVNSVLGS